MFWGKACPWHLDNGFHAALALVSGIVALAAKETFL
jgi:hypothetical protein